MTKFSASLPLWYQLTQLLRSDIVSGRLRPGQRIESEVTLAQLHQISVIPVRRALRALEEEGYVVRRARAGTFVHPSPPLGQTSTSLEALYSREFTRPAEISDRAFMPAPDWLKPYFRECEEVATFQRLAYRDDKPWSYGRHYFPPHLAATMTDQLLQRYPTYRILRELHGLKLVRSHFEAQARAADPETGRRLGIEPFSPLLSLRCVTFDSDDAAVGAFDMVFPSEPFVFAFETAHDLEG